MKAYRFAAALVLGCTIEAVPAFADDGVVITVRSGCDYYAVESAQGIAVLEWYGGHLPSKDEKIAGDFNQFGFQDVYTAPSGVRTHVWVEDYSLSADTAAEKLQDKCR